MPVGADPAIRHRAADRVLHRRRSPSSSCRSPPRTDCTRPSPSGCAPAAVGAVAAAEAAEAARRCARRGDSRCAPASRRSRRTRLRRSCRAARSCIGSVQLTPPPTKKPPFDCQLIAKVARVRFSVDDTIGAMLPSTPTIDAPVIVAASLLTTNPLISAMPRSALRDGNPAPAPQRNAPVGASMPSGWPRNS